MSEDLVGIRTFVDPSIPGFSAIIKQRYSDFIVNEIDLENTCVRLTSHEIPIAKESVGKDKLEAEGGEKLINNSNMSDEDKLNELSVLLKDDEEIMSQIKKMLDSSGNDLESVNLKDDKAKRTEIHKLVKERFSGKMVSETVDGIIRLRMHKKKDDLDTRGKARTDIWKEFGGEFCRFCLFKENRETMEAINFLTSCLRVPGKVFSFAGTKDRRGVTSQWVTAHKVKADRLNGLNKSLRNMRLGNFSYVSQGLKLGDLNGNRFTITLRNVLVDSEETLNRSMISLRDKGFINYFGMQRFGTGSVGTHQVGAAMLRGQWEEAVDLIMKPRLGEGPDLEKARKYWAEHKNPKEALKLFPKRWVAEHQILWSFQKAGHMRSPFEALTNIPRNLRLMYVHAYQSYVWNHMLSERVRLYGADKALVGDLVVENKSALEAEEDMEVNDTPNSKDSNLVQTTTNNPRGSDYVRAKVLTEVDVDQYTIYDVVLPLPGHDIIYPTHAIGEKYKEFMAKDGLEPYKMLRSNKDYSLTGSYRYILTKPENVEWEIVRYNEPNLPLTLTDLDRLEGKTKAEGVVDDAEGKYLALILDLTLRSSQYATMAIREVCKQDTSAAFQSTLNVGGENSAETTATSSTLASGSIEGSAVIPGALEAPSSVALDKYSVTSSLSSTKRDIEQVEGAENAPEAKMPKD
ncbi:pseudouridine synthase [Lobosporangium transversale]|uniref:Pseudouridine synthase n=1 Tax=Lobosporangium transversale TaxID=64571 RepID=A0A1Y2GD71_9FUNG|nr:pseudouridine synthase [Lobosporangium transversale]ORZ05755.1 pseudouridine synthase [Lobosporangium transversale]|eukprot:XP_021877242.1 pseudouridine synthase [Lobosporangium transversale]